MATERQKDEVAEFIRTHIQQFALNSRRVKALVQGAATAPSQSKDLADDILRAAVVMLHATLEDFLRFVGLQNLPYASSATLDGIPLLGTSDTGRPEKFLLGRLAEHRDKSIKQVIQDSITAHLAKRSFSTIEEINGFLISAGVNTVRLKKHYPNLQSLISRRHQIVHRADVPETAPPQARTPQAIDAQTVQQWEKTVNLMITSIIGLGLVTRFNIRVKNASREAKGKKAATSPKQ